MLDYMTLEMACQEKYEQCVIKGNKQSAIRMLRDGDVPLEKSAKYSGLP